MGELGAGVEDVARFIHQQTYPEGGRQYVSFHCCGMRDDNFERALVALEPSPHSSGRHSGTLFIDDVGALGATGQDLLAKLINDERSRARERSPAGVLRVIAGARGTFGNSPEWSQFRGDLIEALSVLQVRIPPLRERPQDIIPTARSLVRERAALLGKTIRGIGPDAKRKLRAHHFPGNQRELEAVIERAVIIEHGGVISEDSITFLETVEPGVAGSLSETLGRFLDLKGANPPSLAEVERAYVACVLSRVNGNRTATARVLRVSYPTIVKKITDYNIDVPRFGRLSKTERSDDRVGSASK